MLNPRRALDKRGPIERLIDQAVSLRKHVHLCAPSGPPKGAKFARVSVSESQQTGSSQTKATAHRIHKSQLGADRGLLSGPLMSSYLES